MHSYHRVCECHVYLHIHRIMLQLAPHWINRTAYKSGTKKNNPQNNTISFKFSTPGQGKRYYFCQKSGTRKSYYRSTNTGRNCPQRRNKIAGYYTIIITDLWSPWHATLQLAAETIREKYPRLCNKSNMYHISAKRQSLSFRLQWITIPYTICRSIDLNPVHQQVNKVHKTASNK